MADGNFLSEVRKIAEQVASREGCSLYDIEFVGGGAGRILRVTIDKEVEGGASIDDCSNVSRGLNLQLDVEDLIPGGHYYLEVSTPGLERVLKSRDHYLKAIGRKISVKTFQPLLEFNGSLPKLGKAKQLQSNLIGLDDLGLKLAVPEGIEERPTEDSANLVGHQREIFVPYSSITKAHMVHEFADPAAKKRPLNKENGKRSGKGKKRR